MFTFVLVVAPILVLTINLGENEDEYAGEYETRQDTTATSASCLKAHKDRTLK
jgi:hypothetical protein